MTLLKLACIYPDNARINAQYRALMPMAILGAGGDELVYTGSSSERPPMQDLLRCDLVHVYRAATPRLLQQLAELQRNGVAICWDNDDDVTAIPRESPSYAHLGGRHGERDFAHQRCALRLADAVTAASHALVRNYLRAGAHNVELVENYLPPEFARFEKSKHRGLVIGWHGLKEHAADVKLLNITSVLARLLECHRDVRVVTVGVKLGIRHDRYEHRAPVPFEQLPHVLGELDIGLAPLADIPFNRSRSNIKLKEYALAGVPWLASPVGEYRNLGSSQGGRVVGDNDWYDAIERLVRSRRYRSYLRLRGKLWARGQTMDAQISRWRLVFEDAVARRRSSRHAVPRSKL